MSRLRAMSMAATSLPKSGAAPLEGRVSVDAGGGSRGMEKYVTGGCTLKYSWVAVDTGTERTLALYSNELWRRAPSMRYSRRRFSEGCFSAGLIWTRAVPTD